MKTVDNSLKGIKKRFGAGITVTDNEIKDIVKVIKSLENRGVLLKGNYQKDYQSRMRTFKFSQTINDSWFTINEKCTYCIGKKVLLPFQLLAGM